jgi:hypothetical protein
MILILWNFRTPQPCLGWSTGVWTNLSSVSADTKQFDPTPVFRRSSPRLCAPDGSSSAFVYARIMAMTNTLTPSSASSCVYSCSVPLLDDRR